MKRFIHKHKSGYYFVSASPCVQDAALMFMCNNEEQAHRVISLMR